MTTPTPDRASGFRTRALHRCGAPDTATPGAHHVSIRPERLHPVPPEGADLTARVERVIYKGNDLQLAARTAAGDVLNVRLPNSARAEVPAPGETLGLQIEEGAARLLVD